MSRYSEQITVTVATVDSALIIGLPVEKKNQSILAVRISLHNTICHLGCVLEHGPCEGTTG
jgi:hypothetical protein